MLLKILHQLWKTIRQCGLPKAMVSPLDIGGNREVSLLELVQFQLPDGVM